MKNADKPAFPVVDKDWTGLTKIELACILLREPATSDSELNHLIVKARKRETAAMIMQGLLAKDVHNQAKLDMLTELSTTIADALLKRLDNA